MNPFSFGVLPRNIIRAAGPDLIKRHFLHLVGIHDSAGSFIVDNRFVYISGGDFLARWFKAVPALIWEKI
jgi:hypothetical protein